jgi:D-glycero-D-manno-heptose 1,7-bisphosphate phosphatase
MVPVRCIHVTTSLADAQINASTRLIEVHGRLPTVDELRARGRDDPRYFGPDALFRYERTAEPPELDEGFTAIDARVFHRHEATDAEHRAVFIEYDEVLCVGRGRNGPALRADDVVLVDGRRELLQRLHDEGWLLFAQAWRPHIARGELTPDDVHGAFERTRELAGVPLALAHCPHDAGSPICWCRKPLPGLILEFAIPRRVALKPSLYVGRAAADRTLAQRLGIPYLDAAEWRELKLLTHGS